MKLLSGVALLLIILRYSECDGPAFIAYRFFVWQLTCWQWSLSWYWILSSAAASLLIAWGLHDILEGDMFSAALRKHRR